MVMYLKEAIIVGFIALGIILFNFGIKFYYIFKRGYRISNLIIIKLVIRTICICLFVGVLIIGFTNKSSFSTKGDFVNLHIVLPMQKENAKFEIDEISKQKIEEVIKIYKFNKIGLVTYSSDLNKYFLAIPPTTKSVFSNLSQSKNLILNVSYLKEVRPSDLAKWQVLDFSAKEKEISNVEKANSMNLDYLNNLIDIPFIKVYLLILLMVLVSSELILKLKIIKI